MDAKRERGGLVPCKLGVTLNGKYVDRSQSNWPTWVAIQSYVQLRKRMVVPADCSLQVGCYRRWSCWICKCLHHNIIIYIWKIYFDKYLWQASQMCSRAKGMVDPAAACWWIVREGFLANCQECQHQGNHEEFFQTCSIWGSFCLYWLHWRGLTQLIRAGGIDHIGVTWFICQDCQCEGLALPKNQKSTEDKDLRMMIKGG